MWCTAGRWRQVSELKHSHINTADQLPDQGWFASDKFNAGRSPSTLRALMSSYMRGPGRVGWALLSPDTLLFMQQPGSCHWLYLDLPDPNQSPDANGTSLALVSRVCGSSIWILWDPSRSKESRASVSPVFWLQMLKFWGYFCLSACTGCYKYIMGFPGRGGNQWGLVFSLTVPKTSRHLANASFACTVWQNSTQIQHLQDTYPTSLLGNQMGHGQFSEGKQHGTAHIHMAKLASPPKQAGTVPDRKCPC